MLLKQISVKMMVIIGLFLAVLICIPMIFGINDAGHRTVVQWPTGKLFVKFTPGPYAKWFGSHEEYMDLITLDFDKKEAAKDTATIDQSGIAVRYQDGGTGTVFGVARFSLPGDEPTMLNLHKAFRSNNGVAHKLIKTVTEEGQNLTAGLMTSEEAYATKRGIFTQWSHQQIATGKFQTEMKTIHDKDLITDKIVDKIIPAIKYGEDGRIMQFESDFVSYGITVTGYQITDWDFEPKTLEQISKKREATMAIITAKANAERAKQDTITAEEQGRANVMVAKYTKEVEKAEAVVDAEKRKDVAVLAAKQQVDVATQGKLEAEQKKLAAAEYEKEQTLRGRGDGAYKRQVFEADGALTIRVDAYKEIMGRAFQELGKQKWVPEVSFGGAGAAGGDQFSHMVNLLSMQALESLGLDIKIPKALGTKQVTPAQ